MGTGGFNIVPEATGLALFGQIGIFWLLFDGGAHFEVKMLRQVGPKAFLIALTGMLMPLCLTMASMKPFGFTTTEALVMGVALAPTSGGMAVRLMQEAGVLQTHLGQVVTAAAMTDDVLSLVLLSIVSNMDGTQSLHGLPPQLDAFLPVASSFVFILVVTGLTPLIGKVLSGWSAEYVVPFMVIWSVGLGLGCQYSLSSQYLGFFLAGVSCSNVHIGDQDTGMNVPTWLEQPTVYSFEEFFVSIFFACAGFVVPMRQIIEKKALLLGLLCGAVAIVSKLVAGVWFPGKRWSVGWAMVARGELGFVVASQALDAKLLSQLGFNVTIWGVLLATFIAPGALAQTLKNSNSSEEARDVEAPLSYGQSFGTASRALRQGSFGKAFSTSQTRHSW
jgi:Kef-type K+ transport system membrane component KefB